METWTSPLTCLGHQFPLSVKQRFLHLPPRSRSGRGRVKQDNDGWETVSSLQMQKRMTLLLFHVEPKLPVSLPAFRVPHCPQGEPSGK